MSFFKQILKSEEIKHNQNSSLNESVSKFENADYNELQEILSEAAFDESKIEKVVKLYSSIFSKRFGSAFKKIAKESYKRKSGKAGIGIRYMNENGVMLRFNWDQKVKSKFLITSIDYWKEGNTRFDKPTRTVEFKPEANVVQILDKAISALKTGIVKESFEESVLAEQMEILSEAPRSARTRAEKEEWALAHGLPKSAAGSTPYMKKKAQEMGLLDELIVFLGETETNSTQEGIKKIEKQFKKEVYANPDTVFQDIEDLTFLISQRKWKSLIILGQGGIGKCMNFVAPLNVKGL